MFEFPKTFKVTRHTDYVGHGSVFYAFEGKTFNGVDLIPLAIAKGAIKIVVDAKSFVHDEILDLIKKKEISLAFSHNLTDDFAKETSCAYDNPHEKLIMIGITGTKGKSTIAFLIKHFFESSGYRVALLSTIKNIIGKVEYTSHLTTPYNDYLNAFLAECITQGVTHVIMEVAAQAMSLSRVAYLAYDYLLFTNFSQEHGEFYPNLKEYFNAKCSLVKLLKKDGKIIYNFDDFAFNEFFSSQKETNIISYGAASLENRYLILKSDLNNLSAKFISGDFFITWKTTTLLGEHNVSNVTAALTLSLQEGCNLQRMCNAMERFAGVPGRCEKHSIKGKNVIVDYAHTPSSFENILKTLRGFTSHMIVLFGCGGERDRVKRPIMTQITLMYADLIILTSDNPRKENQKQIFQDMVLDCPFSKPLYVIPDRTQALQVAFAQAYSHSLIVLLGKGPDHYQIIGNEKIYFNDIEILNNI